MSATNQLMIKIKTTGPAKECKLTSMYSTMKKYDAVVVNVLMKSFPIINTAALTYETAPMRKAFRKIKKKDLRAAGQKDVPKIAQWM